MSPSIDRRLGLTGNTAYKAPVALATTANITLSGEQVIDGATTSTSRVLVKNQNNAVENGLWNSSSGAWSRCVDANGNYDLAAGTQVIVGGGSQAYTIWTLTGTDPITVGSSSIHFAASLDSGNMAALAASGGSALVGFLQSGTGAVASTVQAKLRQTVNVREYGAVGDGTTDDTQAFVKALNVSDRVLADDGTFLVTGLNLDWDQRIVGSGIIKTTAGSLIPLSVATTAPSAALRIMFLEGDTPSFEELLDIKAVGMTAVMAYPWNINDTVLTKNAEAVGLNVIIHSGFTTVPVTVTPNVTLDARPSVIGYYLCDEPIINGDLVVAQERAIDAYRLVTKKPLYCAENSVIYLSAFLSSKWDVVLSDVYYANTHATANVSLQQAVRNMAEYALCAPRAKIMPLVGLFNSTGFTRTTTNVAALAAHRMQFSPDGSFAVYIWDAGTSHGAYTGVRNTTAYRTAVRDLVGRSLAYKPYRVECIPVGALNNSRLHETWKDTTDGASPGLLGTPTMLPWEVINVGAPTDVRRQAYAQDGLMVSASGGTVGFPGMPAGQCTAVFQYTNVGTTASATVSIGYSDSGGYAFTSAVASTATAALGSVILAGTLSTASASNMPMLKVVLSSTTTVQPNAFLTNGYIAFSDVPTVTF